jgi:hypothetical protein
MARHLAQHQTTDADKGKSRRMDERNAFALTPSFDQLLLNVQLVALIFKGLEA